MLHLVGRSSSHLVAQVPLVSLLLLHCDLRICDLLVVCFPLCVHDRDPCGPRDRGGRALYVKTVKNIEHLEGVVYSYVVIYSQTRPCMTQPSQRPHNKI